MISCRHRGPFPFRIPYLLITNLCAMCGEQWPKLFMVSDFEWQYYVPLPLQEDWLCRECYEELKKLFPRGWMIPAQGNRGESP